MKLRKVLPAALILVMSMGAANAADNANNNNVLTGDTRLSCEAILCLSSCTRPGECAPSLSRYFSINAKYMSDTIRKRKNFLSLCPSSNEQGMPQLVNVLANGAGRCDAAELNRMGKRTYQVKVCNGSNRNSKFGNYGNKNSNNCTTVTKTYIANSKPSYCSAYFNHGWTATADTVRYVGEEKNGGKWVNVQQ